MTFRWELTIEDLSWDHASAAMEQLEMILRLAQVAKVQVGFSRSFFRKPGGGKGEFKSMVWVVPENNRGCHLAGIQISAFDLQCLDFVQAPPEAETPTAATPAEAQGKSLESSMLQNCSDFWKKLKHDIFISKS